MSKEEFVENLERVLRGVGPRELGRMYDFISGWAMAVTYRKSKRGRKHKEWE